VSTAAACLGMTPPSFFSQVADFTADLVASGGDFTLGFWVRPTGEESLVTGSPVQTINGR
jgi:hypothetical protein